MLSEAIEFDAVVELIVLAGLLVMTVSFQLSALGWELTSGLY